LVAKISHLVQLNLLSTIRGGIVSDEINNILKKMMQEGVKLIGFFRITVDYAAKDRRTSGRANPTKNGGDNSPLRGLQPTLNP
jgi:hypothetical protein